MGSTGAFNQSSIFGRSAFLPAAYGGQYLIVLSSSVARSASMSKLHVALVLTGYWFLQHSVDHQYGIAFDAINPSILDDFTTATMWWQGTPSV